MDTQCPYGAGECPKIKTIYDMLESNNTQLSELNNHVIELSTTMKNASYVLGIVITILCAVIGVVII